MADIKISQLDNGSTLAGNEYVAIVQNGQTKKTTTQAIADLSGGGGGGQSGYLPVRTNSIVSSSSYDGSFKPEGAVNGVSPVDLRNPDPSTCWSAGQNEVNAWIMIDLGIIISVSAVKVTAFSNYSGAWTGDIKIEGSNDGVTWSSLLPGGVSTMEFTAPYQELTPEEISVSGTCRYVRIVGVDPFTVYYNPSCFFDEISIYCTT